MLKLFAWFFGIVISSFIMFYEPGNLATIAIILAGGAIVILLEDYM